MQRSRSPLPLLLAVAAGCATATPPPAPAPSPAATAPRPALGAEAGPLLLLLEDRRMFDAEALTLFLARPAPEREAAAVALGRIGDPRGRSLAQGLLVDGEPAVRRAAAFALGEIGAPEAKGALLRAAIDEDVETGALAVEALGKLGAPLAEVRKVLLALERAAAERRLAPALFRFDEPAAVEVAAQLLRSASPEVRAGAAYALGRAPRPEGRALLLGLLGDPEPQIRAWAARGVGEVGAVEDLAALLPLTSNAEPSPRIQALRAGARILSRIEALAPSDWSAPLLAAISDPAPGVRAEALEAAGAFLPDPALEAKLGETFGRGEPRERELALGALVEGRAEGVRELVLAASGSASSTLRAAAATSAGALGDRALLVELSGDSEPRVRVAALEALAAAAGEGGVAELPRFLDDPDPTVRAAAFDRLTASPTEPAERLIARLEASRNDRMNDARLAGVRALAARAKAEPREAPAAVEALGRLAEDADYLVRREAASALAGLGAPRPEPGAIDTGHGLEWYRQALVQTRNRRPVVRLETERGALDIRLECPEAPLTCLSFYKLATQGYFDGTVFHRVVPDFVVQGGDPRGDGWGGPGYVLRDEINRLRYRRGAVGMALSGPDTGGSQFFVALSPQPHLDGGYTVFGTLVGGDDVLDAIRQGDRILSARQVE